MFRHILGPSVDTDALLQPPLAFIWPMHAGAFRMQMSTEKDGYHMTWESINVSSIGHAVAFNYAAVERQVWRVRTSFRCLQCLLQNLNYDEDFSQNFIHGNSLFFPAVNSFFNRLQWCSKRMKSKVVRVDNPVLIYWIIDFISPFHLTVPVFSLQLDWL